MWFKKHYNGKCEDACKAFRKFANDEKGWDFVQDFGFHDVKGLDYLYFSEAFGYEDNEYHFIYVCSVNEFFEDRLTKKLRMDAEAHMPIILNKPKTAKIFIDVAQVITHEGAGLIKLHQFPIGEIEPNPLLTKVNFDN